MAMFSVCCEGLAADESTPVSFAREIRPILSNKCHFCHGPDGGKREAEFEDLPTPPGAESPKPDKQESNETRRKLAIHLPATESAGIGVVFTSPPP
jgi:hypothetical protein